MTSFIIQAHVDRDPAPSWSQDDTCAFCRIVQGAAPATKLYEDDDVVAIFDILPLRAGHTLVIPKKHISRLTDLPPELAAAVGRAVSNVARALTEATGNTGLNVVCNQEYAQAVPHVHYHIIPAPIFGSTGDEGKTTKLRGRKVSPLRGATALSRGEMHQREFESREELDEDEAQELAERVRARL
ncbi:HIT-like protein [Macrolepiota fuliginosa MF-IS2]|uniref:HIT-like protein n=1 Tax=Macrolepiota fuliginosa MF-IS2 TaxID=1400762 RepID=A0A9P6C7I3_9AGAR|nr:HIT-like protein [Macrolepiota fuliginosa MF-IS2]